ncbi:MAG: metallophosphatase family protein [Gammaproteobacteria bacterium]|nr:metallophosphatase family protein [Gammaproteobacteria bacterium]MDH5778837.1 metallophosphatase family protein [Gammaproteobacteria bacterium]
MKICIVSDSHDNRFLLAAAVEDAKAKGAELVLHCGDVVAPTTLKILNPIGLPVHVIHGNNTGDLYSMGKLGHDDSSVIQYYGQDAGIELHKKKIFLVHYPHYARAMCATGDWDLVCCGHDHRAEIASHANMRGGETWLVNPGTVGGIGRDPTYVFGDLETMSFQIEPVPIPHEYAYNSTPVTSHS